MTHQACKQTLYKLGWYQFSVPFMCNGWTDQQWIDHISGCNGWLPNGGRKLYFMPDWFRKAGVTLKETGCYDAGTILEPRKETI